MNQSVIEKKEDIIAYLKENNIKKILFVCGNSFKKTKMYKELDSKLKNDEIDVFYFSEYTANPQYDSVVNGVKYFKENLCEGIIVAGGGSAIDVAKCIKLFSNMDTNINYLKQSIVPNDIKLLAIPTTAGTGSESTKYSVIYYDGEKQSITHESSIPQVVLFEPDLLKSLPEYVRKTTMLDALCHAIESFWSVNSNEESKAYSRKAINMIMENMDKYLQNDDNANKKMLMASNISGKAINITQTTAGHAMCYKLTSLYGYAHGHAAALCLSKLFGFMYENMDRCDDIRGRKYLEEILIEVSSCLGGKNISEGIDIFSNILIKLGLDSKINRKDIEYLSESVNTVRLKNNPVKLYKEDIRNIYSRLCEET